MLSIKPGIWQFHGVILQTTTKKWTKWMKNARAESAKLLFLPTEYANLWRSRCRRRCLCKENLQRSERPWWLLLMFGELKAFPLRLLASLAELYYSFPSNQGCDLSSNYPFVILLSRLVIHLLHDFDEQSKTVLFQFCFCFMLSERPP